MKSKKTDERSTPDDLFLPLDEEFHFTLDPCSTHENAKCKRHYTKEENGLLQRWRDEVIFMNPPYSNILRWLNKAENEIRYYNCKMVVCILPCDTSTKWFHNYLWDQSLHHTYNNVKLRFPKGRFKFGGYTTSPQFATIIAVFRSQNDMAPRINSAT